MKNEKERTKHTFTTEIDMVQYPISIIAFDPQGFQVTLCNDTAVEGFLFWANINEPLLSTKHATIHMSALEAERNWILQNQDIGLLPGDIIYPAVYIRRSGRLEKYRYLPALNIAGLVPNLYSTTQIESTTSMTTLVEVDTQVIQFTKRDRFTQKYKVATPEDIVTEATIQTINEDVIHTSTDNPLTEDFDVTPTTPSYSYTPISSITTSSVDYKLQATSIAYNATNLATSTEDVIDGFGMGPQSKSAPLNNAKTSVNHNLLATPASVSTSYMTSQRPFTESSTDYTNSTDYSDRKTTIFSQQFEFYRTSKTASSTEAINFFLRPDMQVLFIAYEPKGLFLMLYTSIEIDEFHFWANINEKFDKRNNADIKLSAYKKIDDVWMVVDDKIKLNVGDVLNYFICVRSRDTSYFRGPKNKISLERDRFKESTTQRTKTSTAKNVSKPSRPKTIAVKECRNNVVLNANDVVVSFNSNMHFKKNLDSSKLSYLKIENCDFTYRIDDSDSATNTLRLVIV